MHKREPLKVDEAETSSASQSDLETQVENEKVKALPKNFQRMSDNSSLEEEIPGVDLDNAMDNGAEIQPIEETALEEIKQSDNFTDVDENSCANSRKE